MPTLPTLMLFVVAVLGMMVSPGPNMALIISNSLALAARGGIVSAAGIFVADLIMTVLVCAGIASLVAAWPPSFEVLRYLGAICLGWLALQVLRRRVSMPEHPPAKGALRKVFHGATLLSLLNPKALLFFLVFLPQFVDPKRGPVTAQLLALGLTLSVIAFVFHALLGMFSDRVASSFRRHAPSVVWLDRLQAGLLFGLAVRLLFLERAIRT